MPFTKNTIKHPSLWEGLVRLLLFSFILTSCNNKNAETAELENTYAYPLEIEKYAYADSSKFAYIEMKMELPVAKDSVSQIIRDSLVAIASNSIRGYFNGMELKIAEYKAKDNDTKSKLDYYCKEFTRLMVDSMSKVDYNEKVKYWDEDTTLTDEQRKEYKENVPPYDYTMNISKVFEDSTYVVFYDSEYTFTGGVHGGVIGYGGITFRFSDGSKIDNFLKDNVVKDMQPLLKKGLKEYFSENADEKVTTDKQLMENLMLSDENNNLIPLPAWTPYPDEKGKGLIFTYQQYEIACYAAGMPSFILTWEELKPFLRDDILEDLKK